MADDVLLNQNMQMLTAALTALNQNMFNKTGGRSSLVGANSQVPGTSTRVGNRDDLHRDTIKQIATNQLLTQAMKSNSEAVKYFTKNASKSSLDLSVSSQKSAEYFKSAIQNFSAKQLDKALPKKLDSFLKKQISAGIVPELKSYEDVVKLQKRTDLKNIDLAVKLAKEYRDATTSLRRQTEIRNTIEQKTGFNLGELGSAVRDDGRVLKEHAGEVSKGLVKFSARLVQAEENLATLKKVGEIFAGIVVAFGADLYKTAVAAQKFGTTVTLSTIKQAAYAGMTGEELMKVQNENIQAIHSSGIGFNAFNQKLDEGASDLLAYTGSLKSGALVTANIFGTFRKLSANSNQLEGFQSKQVVLFKNMNRTLGVTAEQFIEMNDELTNNTSVQAEMYKVSSQQRLNLLTGMQLQVKQLALDGLTIEQSKKLVQSLAEITGGSAKSRFQEAAKVQGVLGALGLGGEGQRAAEIIRKGQHASPQELKELADIQVKAQREVSSQYARGNTAKEFQLDALTDVIGKFLGPNSAGAKLATSQGLAQNKATATQFAQTKALDGLTTIGQTEIMWAEKQVQAITSGFSGVYSEFKNLFELLVGGKLLGMGGGFKNLLPIGGKTGVLSEAAEGAGVAGAGVVATAAAVVTALVASGTTMYSIVQAIRGKDASNFISRFDNKYVGIGKTLTGMFGGGEQYDPNANQMFNTNNYRKSLIANDKKHLEALEQGTQTSDTAKQIAELKEQMAKLVDLQKKQLDATNKQTQIVSQGNQQAAAQADDQTKATKEIKETRTTRQHSVT